MNTSRSQSGFTIIEVIVTIAIFTVLSLGIIGLFTDLFRNSSRQGISIANADQTRKLCNRISQELRNAVSGTNGAYALGTANAQELMFYSNVDGGTDIERVRYYLSAGKLYRGIVKQSGSPAGYTGTETSQVMQTDVANNGSTPLFYYYNDTYDDNTDSALSQPVNVAQVTYVKLNIEVYKKTDPNSTGKYTVTAGTTLRSLKANLGN